MNKKRILIEDEYIQNSCKNKSYEYNRLINIQAKNIEFRNVNFKYSIIESSYFHQATFYDCDFTGAIIKETNFRSANFTRCKFDYAQFHKTIIPYDQLLSNLPSWENVRLTFLKNIRINAEEIGEKDIIEKLIIKEAETLTIHYEKAFKHSNSYYRDKYKGFTRFKSFVKFLSLKFNKLLWNHGYSYYRIIFLSLIAIAFISMFPTARNIHPDTTFITITHGYLQTLIESLLVYIDYINLTLINLSKIEVILIILLRYITIGLIVNILYVKNIKK